MNAPPPLPCRLLTAQATSSDGDRLVDIPDYWTAEEALIVSSFFEAVVSAIWDRHGCEMAGILSRLNELEQAQEAHEADDGGGDSDPEDDDDIPF